MEPRSPARFSLEHMPRWLAPLAGHPYDPDTLRSVPSWGLSVLLHALLLLVLALLIRVGQGKDTNSGAIESQVLPPEIGDLTSLVEAPRAGDPFTNEQNPNPPSLGLEGAEPEMKFAAQPQVAALSRFGPQLASPSPLPDLALSIKGTPRFPGLADVVTAPFSGRQGMERAALVRREGGTVHSEKAVEHGIEWIVRHQKSDGSWSLSFQEQCQAQGCPPDRRA